MVVEAVVVLVVMPSLFQQNMLVVMVVEEFQLKLLDHLLLVQ